MIGAYSGYVYRYDSINSVARKTKSSDRMRYSHVWGHKKRYNIRASSAVRAVERVDCSELKSSNGTEFHNVQHQMKSHRGSYYGASICRRGEP
jgi:hypothetical protein